MTRSVPRAVVSFLLALRVAAAAPAESAASDSQMVQAMLTEVRQLRQDLQAAAATIQRVQIVMFRLQGQGGVLENAKQRLEQSRFACKQIPAEREMLQSQIEQAGIRKRNAQNTAEQSAADGFLSQINSQIAELAARERDCQVQLAEGETQLRSEDAKMNDLQDQLDKLDKILANNGRK